LCLLCTSDTVVKLSCLPSIHLAVTPVLHFISLMLHLCCIYVTLMHLCTLLLVFHNLFFPIIEGYEGSAVSQYIQTDEALPEQFDAPVLVEANIYR
jgi:hypothetical protein